MNFLSSCQCVESRSCQTKPMYRRTLSRCTGSLASRKESIETVRPRDVPEPIPRLPSNLLSSTLLATRSTHFPSQTSFPSHRTPVPMAGRLADRPHHIGRRQKHERQLFHRPRSTRRSQPLANRPSVWITLSLGKAFLRIDPFRLLTSRTFLYLLHVRPLFSIQHIPNLFYF